MTLRRLGAAPAQAGLVIALLLAAPAAAAELVTLRSDIVVEGATITLGDMFDGAGALAATRVARAPAPGEPVVRGGPGGPWRDRFAAWREGE